MRPTLSDNADRVALDSNEQPGKYKRICHEVTPLNDSRLFPPLSSAGILMPGRHLGGGGEPSLPRIKRPQRRANHFYDNDKPRIPCF